MINPQLCKNGHPREEGNLYQYKNKYKTCRTCMQESKKKTIAREKELSERATRGLKLVIGV